MWKQSFECSGINEPNFEDNPSGWFDWFDDCMSGENGNHEPPPIPCRPGRYSVNGKCWQIVCTTDGTELRPCFTTPIPPNINSVIVTAVCITNNGFLVQTQSAKGLKTDKIKHGKIRLKHIAAALIYKKPLPNPEIKKVASTFWEGIKPLP